MHANDKTLVWFEALGRNDVARVGGKNASLGEMISKLSNRFRCLLNIPRMRY